MNIRVQSFKCIVFHVTCLLRVCHTVLPLCNLKQRKDEQVTKLATRWRNWLRHCAKSRKVAGLMPDDVIILPAALWPWLRLSL